MVQCGYSLFTVLPRQMGAAGARRSLHMGCLAVRGETVVLVYSTGEVVPNVEALLMLPPYATCSRKLRSVGLEEYTRITLG